jgi:hypothetical protein
VCYIALAVSHPAAQRCRRQSVINLTPCLNTDRLPLIRQSVTELLLGCKNGNGSNSLPAEELVYATGSGFIADLDLRGALRPVVFRKVVVCRTNSIIIGGGPVSFPRRVTSNGPCRTVVRWKKGPSAVMLFLI